MRTRGVRPVAALGFRPEIEGLRAFAVVLVVADHLGVPPRGGFIGVDVFFVISGFLITGLLVSEQSRTGRVSIAAFYQRRARRILPAAAVVLIGTWIAARLLFLTVRAHEAAVDVYWAAVFGANIHFADIGTDYFQADRPQSPVQHFWSLAVEEQFYLVWPLALVVLLLIGRRLAPSRPRLAPTIATGLLVVALFAVAVQQTRSNSTAAYFGTSARAWELGVGAVLALVSSSGVRVGHRVAGGCVAAGVAAVLAAGFLVRQGAGFPAPAAAVPVLGAALIILSTSAASPSVLAWPLTNPVSRYLGRVSYSLYLWHWPVIVFVQARFTGSRPHYLVVCLLLTAALTIATHHLVENPLRRASFRPADIAARVRLGIRATAHRSGAWRPGTSQIAAATAIVCTLLAVVAWRVTPTPARHGYAPQAAAPVAPATLHVGEVDPPAALTADIDSALASTHFPTLNPSLDELPNSKVSEWQPCGNVDTKGLADCTFPSAIAGSHKSVVVIGDSIGITWLPAIRGLQAKGYTVYGLTHSQCPAAAVDTDAAVDSGSDFTAGCNAHRAWSIHQVAVLHPSVVVLASSLDTVHRLADGATGAAAYAEWQHGTQRTIHAVRANGAQHIALLAPPPPGRSLQTCAPSTQSDPGKCVGRVSADWLGITAAERSASQATGVRYIDTELLFCAVNGYCPSFVGATPVRVDGNHLSETYSKRLAPVLDPLIAAA